MSHVLNRYSFVERRSYYNRPKFLLAPDPSLLAPLEIIQRFPKEDNATALDKVRLPLGRLSANLDTVTASVVGKWSKPTSPNLLKAFHGGSDSLPLPPTLEDIIRMEPDLSPTSAMMRAGNITLSLRDTRQGRRVQVDSNNLPLTRPPKRLRTPYPTNHGPEQGREEARKRPRKDTSLTPYIAVPLTTAAVDSAAELQEGNLPLVTRWLAGHLHSTLSYSNDYSSLTLSDRVAQEAMLSKILLHFQPKPTIVVLALWYISRLFPAGLVESHLIYGGGSAVELIIRVFILGIILAYKWLDDFTFKTATWSCFCSLSIASINHMERSALKILDYNISITNSQWESWLLGLKYSVLPYSSTSRSSRFAMEVVNDLLLVAPRALGEPRPNPIPPTHRELSHILRDQVTEGLRMAEPLAKPTTPVALREPSPWNPRLDPIIPRSQYVRYAPGAPESTISAVSAIRGLSYRRDVSYPEHYLRSTNFLPPFPLLNDAT